jgi:hypothetical protein
VIVEGAREKDRDHLFAAPVPQTQPVGRRHARAAVRAEERGARDAPRGRERRIAAPVVVVDAQMEVPRARVDGQVAVAHRERGRRRQTDLPRRAFDHRAERDRGPVLAEELAEQPGHRVAGHGHLVVTAHAAVGLAHHRVVAHAATVALL